MFSKVVKKKFNQVADEFNDESKAHKKLQELVSNLEIIGEKDTKNNPYTPKVRLAAINMLSALKKLLSEDSKDIKSKFPMNQYNLAQNALDVIYTHKVDLEAAPGLWNKFKAYINVFFEEYFGCVDVLSVERTAYGEKKRATPDGLVSLTSRFKLDFDDFVHQMEAQENRCSFNC